MRKPVILFVGLLLCFSFFQLRGQLNIIPQPSEVKPSTGAFIINSTTRLVASDTESKAIAQIFADYLKIVGATLQVTDANRVAGTTNLISFTKTAENAFPTEGYQLEVSTRQMTVRAATNQGLFYGLQTLLQLLPPEIFSETPLRQRLVVRVPAVSITDAPRFGYRGLHLDVSRHFFPVSFIKKYIDVIAFYKMNTFHWHLTDDQGWRIEIKKYPKLTTVGSVRKETLVGRYGSNKYDGTAYGGYYTQEQIKDVVSYAKARFVNIIPEIEMPGHALAALAAYPELSCDPSKKYEVATTWGVQNDVFCPNEETFTFLENVLTEVINLFPSPYIHIGGDECPKDAWKKSAFCQDLIKKENLKDEHGLQSYFIKRIEKFVNSKGRRIIGWDEILEGGLAPNATVMSWRGIEGGIEAAKQKHDVVMTPGSHTYFDHYQADPDTEPLAIGGLTTLDKTYGYEPIPDVLTPEQAKYIKGVQGCLWTEYIKTAEYAEYMAFPRAIALAEVAWSPKSGRTFASFANRLQEHFKRLDILKINYSKRLFDVKIQMAIDKNASSKGVVSLSSVFKGGELRYTTNGQEPEATSLLYTKPFSVSGTATVKAAIFQRGKAISKSSVQTFYGHTALGMAYKTITPPKNTYESGALGLTNGIRGSLKSYAQWTGFLGNDMEVILDFGTARDFKEVRVQFAHRPSSWIFLPDNVILSVSNDGLEWQDINRVDYAYTRPDEETIREARMTFSGFTQPKRYLKVLARNIGKCPKGHPGEGQAAWLFADEIMVD